MLGLLPMPGGLVETCRRAPPCFSCLFRRCGLLSWWANDPGWRRLEPRPRFRSVARSAWMVVGCRAGEAQRDHVNDNCSIRHEVSSSPKPRSLAVDEGVRYQAGLNPPMAMNPTFLTKTDRAISHNCSGIYWDNSASLPYGHRGPARSP